ncbi:hypothetical protein QJS66_05855 [Kocuria rhizophila]|nr:hypothetical protein QJS66_05855 [Kocuria rhizophila]
MEVVDAAHVHAEQRGLGPRAARQAAAALVLAKTDVAEPTSPRACAERIAQANPHAMVLDAPWGAVDPTVLRRRDVPCRAARAARCGSSAPPRARAPRPPPRREPGTCPPRWDPGGTRGPAGGSPAQVYRVKAVVACHVRETAATWRTPWQGWSSGRAAPRPAAAPHFGGRGHGRTKKKGARELRRLAQLL